MRARYSVWARNPNNMSIQYVTGLCPESGTGNVNYTYSTSGLCPEAGTGNVRYTYRFTYDNGAAPLAPGPISTHPLGRSM